MNSCLSSNFEVRLARSDADITAVQRLRYDVFVKELGADGPMVDHDLKLEKDQFDPYFDHLMLVDHNKPNTPVVGVYRLLLSDQMPNIGQYYSETEFNISLLKASGRRLLELGRSCIHVDYRGGRALFHLWNGLAEYITTKNVDVLFGVASFHGTDINALSQPLSQLYYNHLTPEELRPTAHPDVFQAMDLVPENQLDYDKAASQMPTLLKSYLRLGGTVGLGAYIDYDFNTTDVCVVVDTKNMTERHKTITKAARK